MCATATKLSIMLNILTVLFLSKIHSQWTEIQDIERGNFAEAIAEKIMQKQPGKVTNVVLLHQEKAPAHKV